MNTESYKALKDHQRELRAQEARFRRLGVLCAKHGKTDEANAAVERARSVSKVHLAVSSALAEVSVPDAAGTVMRAGKAVSCRVLALGEARG